MMDQRKLGSLGDFDQQWREALTRDARRHLNYPSNEPETQYELFEHVKATHLDRLLASRELAGCRVLEYGCGSAGMSVYLANHGFDTVATDASLPALRLAEENASINLAEEASEHFSMAAANAFHLPFGDGQFDIAMSYGLLEHFGPEVLEPVLVEVLRILRPGGLFVADIAHGRRSVRTFGIWLSLLASLTLHAATFRWRRLPELPAAYLDHCYENDLDEQAWVDLLRSAGLISVGARVLHPFPPLALSGSAERFYVGLMQHASPLVAWFDETQPRWARRWGWLYLTWGAKPK